MKPFPHHFYKSPIDSPVGQSLTEYIKRCNSASEKARQWAEQQGADSYIESYEGMAGGIAAIEFADNSEHEGFERIESRFDGSVYYLPTPGSDLEKEMYALPVVSETELIAILQFQHRISKTGKPMPFTFGNQSPVLFAYNGYWYVDMPYVCQAPSLAVIGEKEFYRRRMSALNKT